MWRQIVFPSMLLSLGILPISAGSAEEQEQPQIEVRIIVNGKETKISGLDALREHADELADHVDVAEILRQVEGGKGSAKVIIMKQDAQGGDSPRQIEMLQELRSDGTIPDGAKLRFIMRPDGNEKSKWIAQGDVKPGKFMIGLACGIADETLRSHLGLSQSALIVLEPLEGTPAAKADLQQHDVLVSADGEPLTDLVTLIKLVDAAGREERGLELTIIRKGKEKSVTVTPVVRPEKAEWTIDLDDGPAEGNSRRKVLIRPGKQEKIRVEVEKRDDESTNEIDALQAELDSLREMVKDLKKHLEED